MTDAIETALNQVAGGMSSPDAQCVAFLRTLCLAAGIADRPMCSLALSSERQTERQKGRKTERQKDRQTERQKDRKTDTVAPMAWNFNQPFNHLI